MTPASINTVESIEQHVTRLLRQWREETEHLSSSRAITEHPAYLELISLGQAGLPFLFRDLELTADGHLSKALTAITGARPIPEEQRGRIRAVAGTWLRSARENGY